MKLFGYDSNKEPTATSAMDPSKPEQKNISFVTDVNDDGAVVVSGGGAYGMYVDVDGIIRNDSDRITQYRTMSDHPALDIAVTSIVNEAIINEPEVDTVAIDLSDCPSLPKATKKKVEAEFKNILNLLNFDLNGYEIFRRWYIDGRLFYHAIIDPKNVNGGIIELRYIDPRKIRKVREVETIPLAANAAQGAGQMVKTKAEYYVFNERGFTREDLSSIPNSGSAAGSLKISKDAIIHITSGQMDAAGKSVVSYLHKAIRPLNQLTMLQDSMVIYRLARAPERRIFSVDVSGMPKAKAEQYLKSVMNNFKTKITYDSATGEVRDDRKFMSMFEDFWFARRDGGKGTEVDTLPGGENLGEIDDILYMQRQLYQSLNIPVSRIESESTYTLGRATEISREEVGFEKFVTRLRARFSIVFLNALRVQLLLKNIINPDDWEAIKNTISFIYSKDNLFAEMKMNEVMTGRLTTLQLMEPYIGRFFSNEQVRREVLHQTEEMMDEIDEQIEKEKSIAQYAPPMEPGEPDQSGDLMSPGGQAQLPDPGMTPADPTPDGQGVAMPPAMIAKQAISSK